jgi:hypothetical protein
VVPDRELAPALSVTAWAGIAAKTTMVATKKKGLRINDFLQKKMSGLFGTIFRLAGCCRCDSNGVNHKSIVDVCLRSNGTPSARSTNLVKTVGKTLYKPTA